jgi:hypothetical protein
VKLVHSGATFISVYCRLQSATGQQSPPPPNTTRHPPAHWPALNLGHVDVTQCKHAECLEQLPRSLLEAEHNAGLEGLGLSLTLTRQQGLPIAAAAAAATSKHSNSSTRKCHTPVLTCFCGKSPACLLLCPSHPPSLPLQLLLALPLLLLVLCLLRCPLPLL